MIKWVAYLALAISIATAAAVIYDQKQRGIWERRGLESIGAVYHRR